MTVNVLTTMKGGQGMSSLRYHPWRGEKASLDHELSNGPTMAVLKTMKGNGVV